MFFTFATILCLRFGIGVLAACLLKSTSTHINCSHKKLSKIPLVPENTTYLDLSFNQISRIPNKTFIYLSDLLWMDLSRNNLSSIGQFSFVGLESLLYINMSFNKFHVRSFATNSLRPITQLKILRLDGHIFNQITGFPDEIANLKYIEIFEIGAFVGMQFDHRFLEWHSLHTFKSTDSKEFILKNDTLSGLKNSPLKHIYIKIEKVEPGALSEFQNFEDIDINFGYKTTPSAADVVCKMITKCGNITSFVLKRVNKHSHLFFIKNKQLRYLENVCIKELIISGLYMLDIDGTGLESFALKSVCLERLELSGRIGGFTWIFYVSLFKNLKYIKYSSFNSAFNYGLSRVNIRLPAVKVRLPKTLEEIVVENINNQIPLPNVTFLQASNLRSIRIVNFPFVDCMANISGLTMVRYVDFSKNNCSSLNENIFNDMNNLESLTASDIQLGTAFRRNKNLGQLIHPIKNLKNLDVSKNELEDLEIPSNLISDHQFNTLETINISYNRFRNIPIYKLLGKLTNLKILDISYNLISDFGSNEREWIDKFSSTNFSINVSYNPFKCFCSNLDFLRWGKRSTIVDLRPLDCTTDDGNPMTFASVFGHFDEFENQCASKTWLIFSICTSITLVLIIALSIIYTRYKAAFQYLYLKMKIKVNKYEELNGSTFLYDVFISFNHDDVSWVVKLHRTLCDRGLNACLHYKDFIAGDSIAENIVRAVDNSRKVIFVISESFLKSTWGNYEMEITRMHAFQDGRDGMVIVILKDDIPVSRMPKTLRHLWYKVTCIKWYEHGEQPFQTEEVFYANVFNAISYK